MAPWHPWHKLVGRAAVATYHGAAMRLAGISIRDMAEFRNKDSIDFDRIIKGAVKLLKGEKDIPGVEADELRDRLLAGYSHILVDEYQDIDKDQYDLVSAIAGRQLEEDGRLTILAVGDDDQNIYTFRGSNVRFIRQFQKDYSTKIIYLVENYRSSKHIIVASNALIRGNRDRMKGAHPICINRERKPNLPGGRWEQIDPVNKGCVQIVSAKDVHHQAGYVKSEIDRMKTLDPNAKWRDFAVLARTKAPMAAVRSVLEDAGYPLKTTLDKGLPLHRVREVQMALEWLMVKEKENARAIDLQTGLKEVRGDRKTNIWWQLIDRFLDAYRQETADSMLPFTYRGMVAENDHADKKYNLLGLNEIYLDYAGTFPQAHPIHDRLARLEAGQFVSFYPNSSMIEIHDPSGNCVARLSNEGANTWRERLDEILEVRIVAMLRRNREDPDENFQKWIKADTWDILVVEVVRVIGARS